MSIRMDPDPLSDSDPGHPSRRNHRRRFGWGYISRDTSRYGTTETEVVVYPPDSSERERRWATSTHAFAPVAAAVTVVAALAVVLAGASPAHAFPAMLALLAVGGAVVLAKTTKVRGGSASAWVGVSVLHPDPDRVLLQNRLGELAETMIAAEDALGDGRISTEEYARTWRDVFAEVTALDQRRRS